MMNMTSLAVRNRLFFILIFLICVAVRFAYLDKSLCGDEINSVLGAKEQLKDIAYSIAKSDSYPPLQYILLHFWMLVGSCEAWIRVLYALFGVGVCIVVYLIGKEYVDERFGLYSMFFAAVSPQLVHLSQYVRGIIISAFFICAGLYFLIHILNGKGGLLNWLGYIVCGSLAIYSFYFSALILVAENLYILFRIKDVRKVLLRNWIIAQLLIGLSFIPWLSLFKKQVFHTNLVGNVVSSSVHGFFLFGIHFGSLVRSILGTFGVDLLFLNTITFSKKLPLFVLCSTLVLCFFVLLCVVIKSLEFFRKKTACPKVAAWFFHFLILVTIVLAVILRHIGNLPLMSHYFAAVSIFFIFILVGAVLAVENKIFRFLLFSLLTLLFLIRLPALYLPSEDWRQAVSYVEAKSLPGDCVVFLAQGKNDYKFYSKSGMPQFIFAKYMTRDAKTAEFIKIDSQNSQQLLKNFQPYKRMWVVLTHTRIFGGVDVLRDWFLKNNFIIEDEKNFIGVDILLYRHGQ